MSALLEPAPPAPAPPPARWRTVADLLHDLGDIPADRVRMNPPPGHATFTDLIDANNRNGEMPCEWVEDTLVEKAMGQYESWVTTIIIGRFDRYLEAHDMGMLYAPGRGDEDPPEDRTRPGRGVPVVGAVPGREAATAGGCSARGRSRSGG